MDLPKLIYMANQIAGFFEAQGEDVAVTGAEDHLRRFWDPRMRREIVGHLKAGGDGLTPVARAAVERLAAG